VACSCPPLQAQVATGPAADTLGGGDGRAPAAGGCQFCTRCDGGSRARALDERRVRDTIVVKLSMTDIYNTRCCPSSILHVI
jgi:hypothetical protein